MSKPNVGILATKDWVISLINKVIKKGFNGYSTDEKRIGTWVDGKPIYRKVLNNLNISVTAFNYNATIDISDMNIDTIMPSTCGYDRSYGNWRIAYWDVKSYEGKLACYPMHDGTINIIVLEYTKTTDHSTVITSATPNTKTS